MMVKKMVRYIINKLRKKEVLKNEKILMNMNYNPIERQERVLISYIDFSDASDAVEKKMWHTNRNELFLIMRYFIERNFVIDICDNRYMFEDKEISDRYQVIFGFGNAFRYAVEKCPKAYSILYMTENPYWVSYYREMQRIEYLYQRKRIEAKLQRTGVFYKEDDEQLGDAILSMASLEYFDKIEKPIERIYPSALKNMQYDFGQRKPDKKKFLILGSAGFVHKGFDIVMEIFNSHKDWTLYYCGGHLEEELKKVGVPWTENIIDVGFVDIQSEQFKQLAQECMWCLQFSCSEGTSTSVLTCMMHGLIPMVLHGIGLDELSEFCIYSDDYLIENVENTILRTIEMEEDYLSKLSYDIYQFSNKAFSLERFDIAFGNAMNNLLKNSRN